MENTENERYQALQVYHGEVGGTKQLQKERDFSLVSNVSLKIPTKLSDNNYSAGYLSSRYGSTAPNSPARKRNLQSNNGDDSFSLSNYSTGTRDKFQSKTKRISIHFVDEKK